MTTQASRQPKCHVAHRAAPQVKLTRGCSAFLSLLDQSETLLSERERLLSRLAEVRSDSVSEAPQRF
jgi:hypothetical protein